MATAKELALINTLREEGAADNGRPSFLREWTPVRFLGRGNFGEVYEIRRYNERCALKIVAMDDEFIDQYAAEIDALRRIRDEKHAVRIEEYEILGVDRGAYIQRYMIIRMGLLSKLPADMDEDGVIKLGLDMCDILAKCHGGTPKIFHCDIKPENILSGADGSFMLSDFGAARISDKTHNSTGFRGTPLYMSPEMHDYKGYDARSDLYSLGITMYTLLNGGLQPFSDGTNHAQAIRMRFDGKKLPDIPGASAGMMKILRRLCAADPNKRYRTARELAADLGALAAARAKAAREEARKREEREAAEKRRAEQEEAKRRAREQAARANTSGENGAYAATAVQGGAPAPAAQTKRRPLPAVVTAVALAVCIAFGGGAYYIAKVRDAEGQDPAAEKSYEEICEESAEMLDYIETDGGYSVAGCALKAVSIIIPSEYNGKPVVGIADQAFISHTMLREVEIPGTVRTIGDSAFSHCQALRSIIIPDGVVTIGRYAFYDCKLDRVTIPESVTSIGQSAFVHYDDVLYITYGGNHTNIYAPHEQSYYGREDIINYRALWIVK